MHNFTSSSASFDRTVECLYHFLLDGLASPQEMVQLRREATRFDLHRVASQHAADSKKTAKATSAKAAPYKRTATRTRWFL